MGIFIILENENEIWFQNCLVGYLMNCYWLFWNSLMWNKCVLGIFFNMQCQLLHIEGYFGFLNVLWFQLILLLMGSQNFP